jgi:hypothetical protein
MVNLTYKQKFLIPVILISISSILKEKGKMFLTPILPSYIGVGCKTMKFMREDLSPFSCGNQIKKINVMGQPHTACPITTTNPGFENGYF